MENLFLVDQLLIFFALGALYVIAKELRACGNILEDIREDIRTMQEHPSYEDMFENILLELKK